MPGSMASLHLGVIWMREVSCEVMIPEIWEERVQRHKRTVENKAREKEKKLEKWRRIINSLSRRIQVMEEMKRNPRDSQQTSANGILPRLRETHTETRGGWWSGGPKAEEQKQTCPSLAILAGCIPSPLWEGTRPRTCLSSDVRCLE